MNGWERAGQEQPAGTNGPSGWRCREGVTPAEIPLVAVCMRRDVYVYTHTGWESACGEQLKKLEPPVQPTEGGEEISSSSAPHNFSS